MLAVAVDLAAEFVAVRHRVDVPGLVGRTDALVERQRSHLGPGLAGPVGGFVPGTVVDHQHVGARHVFPGVLDDGPDRVRFVPRRNENEGLHASILSDRGFFRPCDPASAFCSRLPRSMRTRPPRRRRRHIGMRLWLAAGFAAVGFITASIMFFFVIDSSRDVLSERSAELAVGRTYRLADRVGDPDSDIETEVTRARTAKASRPGTSIPTAACSPGDRHRGLRGQRRLRGGP